MHINITRFQDDRLYWIHKIRTFDTMIDNYVKGVITATDLQNSTIIMLSHINHLITAENMIQTLKERKELASTIIKG